MNKVLSVTAGRSTERPVYSPDVRLYRGRAGDGADCLVTFDCRTVVLSRPVAGLACRIRLGTNQFQAVAAIARQDRHVIQLMHSDPGLSIDLAEAGSLEDAEDHGERLAMFLNLPQVTLAGRSASGDTVMSGAASAKRRNQPARLGTQRRPRFLTRRKTGNIVSFRKFEGSELIART